MTTVQSGSPRQSSSPRTAALALAADAACILVFIAIGRRNHGEGVTLAGIAQTAWPFLTGLVAGWLLSRAWRQPTAVRTGAMVWPVTIAIGIGIRAATGAGIATSFIVVATLVTGALLMGWRAALAGLAGRKGAGRKGAGRKG